MKPGKEEVQGVSAWHTVDKKWKERSGEDGEGGKEGYKVDCDKEDGEARERTENMV